MNSALMLHRHASPAVAGSYTIGAVIGASVSAAGLLLLSGLVSPLPAASRGAVAVLIVLLLVLHVTRIVCLDWLPQRAYQIPRETFVAAPTRAAFRFAFELGTGVRTYITATAPYALVVVLLLVMPPDLGEALVTTGAAAVGYGLGRSLVVATQSLRSTIAVQHPNRWLRASDIAAVALALAIAIRFLIEHG